MNTREIAVEYRMSHWAQIMQNRIDSGLNVRAFCKNAGIHENSYYYWQRKLREATCEELTRNECGAGLMPPMFAEVKLATRSTFQPMAANQQNNVCVEASGVRITADSGYPVDKLAYLMRAVMRSC